MQRGLHHIKLGADALRKGVEGRDLSTVEGLVQFTT